MRIVDASCGMVEGLHHSGRMSHMQDNYTLVVEFIFALKWEYVNAPGRLRIV